MFGDIPTVILKSNVNIHLDFLTDIIYKSFRDGEFPNILKYPEVFPFHKKKGHVDKESYRYVSVLLHMSKIFERLIHGFTISVPGLILPVFRHLLLRNRKMWNKSLFWNERIYILYIFKLVLYFNSFIISNQVKYYLTRNRWNFLQIQYGFYGHALQIYYHSERPFKLCYCMKL